MTTVAVTAHPLAPGRVKGWTGGGFGIPDAYLDAVTRAGGIPVVLVPPRASAEGRVPEAVAGLGFDALLLIGGGDVDPARYGAEADPRTGGVDPDRDAFELELAARALRGAVPTLAVCRGVQVLNVAAGGTLHQHIPDVVDLDHGRDGDSFHSVRVAARSRLAAVCGSEVERCASHHHQAIDRLGEGLRAVGWSEDGLVEAVEATKDDSWVLGVQWHPERTAATDAAHQALFSALVEQGSRGPEPRRLDGAVK